MGGGAMPEGGGKGKKKSLDAIINVVPAIDLLSCCISFLLFTAVWTQISRLQAQQMGQDPNPVAAEEQKQMTVTVQVLEKGFVINSTSPTGAAGALEIPALGKRPDGSPQFDLKELAAKLKQLKVDFPDQAAFTVAAEDAVLYEDLVRVIDTCVGAGLVSVSVTATS